MNDVRKVVFCCHQLWISIVLLDLVWFCCHFVFAQPIWTLDPVQYLAIKSVFRLSKRLTEKWSHPLSFLCAFYTVFRKKHPHLFFRVLKQIKGGWSPYHKVIVKQWMFNTEVIICAFLWSDCGLTDGRINDRLVKMTHDSTLQPRNSSTFQIFCLHTISCMTAHIL